MCSRPRKDGSALQGVHAFSSFVTPIHSDCFYIDAVSGLRSMVSRFLFKYLLEFIAVTAPILVSVNRDKNMTSHLPNRSTISFRRSVV